MMSDTNTAISQNQENARGASSEPGNASSGNTPSGPSASPVVHRGTVKWFNDAKGFGFIEHGSGKDVFVHYSVIEWDGFKTLKDGEEVEYVLKEGEKGLHAARVSRPNVKPEAQKPEETAKQQTDNGIAPSLESGNVQTHVQSLSDSIEVERVPTQTSTIGIQQSEEEKDEDNTVL
jgi:CspA family cold shock protein